MSRGEFTLFSLCSCLLLCVPVFAEPSGADAEILGPPAVAARDLPALTCENTDYDFGEVRRGDVVEHSFLFENTGIAPLRLLKVKPSCGCTAVDYDRVIEPGTTGAVTLRLQTEKLTPGHACKTARITTNDPNLPQVRLSMNVEVVGIVATSPKKLELAGPMAHDKSLRVTITPLHGEAVFIEEISSQAKRLDLGAVRAVEAGRRYEIELRANGVDRPVKLRDNLEVKFRDSKGTLHTRRMPVLIDHQDRFVISPMKTIVFRRSETTVLLDRAPVRKEIVISASSGERFPAPELEIVDAPAGLFETDVRELAPGRYALGVTLGETLSEQRFLRAKLIVKTNDGVASERRIPLFVQFPNVSAAARR